MITLDYTKLTKKQIKKLQKTKDYVPLSIHFLLDNNYFNRATEKAKQQYYKNRTDLQCVGDKGKYLEEDLMEWIKEHEDFKNMIIKE